MKATKVIHFILFSMATLLFMRSATQAAPAVGLEIRSFDQTVEMNARTFDEAGADAHRKAISSIKGLLKKYRGMGQEPLLMLRLVDNQAELAAVEYRISHSPDQNKAKLAKIRHKQILDDLVQGISSFFSKFPGHPDIPHMHYQRGTAYEELAQNAKALNDYKTVVERFSTHEHFAKPSMAAGDLLTKEKDHRNALGYYNLVIARKDDVHFPIALYRAGWSLYNLNRIDEAVTRMKNINEYYGQIATKSETAQSGSAAVGKSLRETALLDMALFLAEPYKTTTLAEQDAHSVLEILLTESKAAALESTSIFGQMSLRFCRVMRVVGEGQSLFEFWSQWQNYRSKTAEDSYYDGAYTAAEYYSQKRDYQKFAKVLSHVIDEKQQSSVAVNSGMKDSDLQLKNNIQKVSHQKRDNVYQLFAKSIEEYHGMLVKNKSAQNIQKFLAELATLYEETTHLFEANDLRLTKIRYNLGEVYFLSKKYVESALNYRSVVLWLSNYGKNVTSIDSGSAAMRDLQSAALKSISSAHHYLLAEGLIPNKLDARSLKLAKEASVATERDSDLFNKKRELMPITWVQWIDSYQEGNSIEKDFEQYAFDANRMLYQYTPEESVLSRFEVFILKHDSSVFAAPSISLLVDTLIKDERWLDLNEKLDRFMPLAKKNASVAKLGLEKIHIKVNYKIAELWETQGRYEDAFKLIRRAIDKKSGPEFYVLATKLALRNQDYERAIQYAQDQIVKSYPEIYLYQVQIYEDLFDLKNARAKLDEMNHGKIVERSSFYNALLTEDFESESYRASNSDDRPLTEAERKLWSSLRQAKQMVSPLNLNESTLSFNQKEWSKYWPKFWKQLNSTIEESDPMTRVYLLQVIHKRAASVFDQWMVYVSQATLDLKKIHTFKARMERMHEMEEFISIVQKTPLDSIGLIALDALTQCYDRFLKDSKKLSNENGEMDNLRDVLLPFEDKIAGLTKAVYERAQLQSISTDQLNQYYSRYSEYNPSAAKAVGNKNRSEELTIDTLFARDRDGNWANLKVSRKLSVMPRERLQQNWLAAMASEKYVLAQYLLERAKSKAILSEQRMHLMQGVILSAIGARSEGQSLFRDVLAATQH